MLTYMNYNNVIAWPSASRERKGIPVSLTRSATHRIYCWSDFHVPSPLDQQMHLALDPPNEALGS